MEEEDDDWDLQAVVRGCCTSTTTAATTASPSHVDTVLPVVVSTFNQPLIHHQFVPSPDPSVAPRTSGTDQRTNEDLHDLFRVPFFPKSLQPPPPPDHHFSLLMTSKLQDPSPQPQQQQKQKQLQQPTKQNQQLVCGSRTTSTNNTTTSTALHTTQSPRSKRRKNVMKRVCHVPAEGLSSDMWSWRKYGQKPIKGSPYPRGYYRCSTSKGCLARKQVERNRSDPNMFIVTYTAEHNHPIPTHRNSLAGSTRHKPETTQTASGDEAGKPTCSAEKTESREGEREVAAEDGEEEEEGDELDVSDMVVSDDFFDGLDDLAGTIAGDSLSGESPASFPFPWQANSVTPATAGGG